MRINFVITMPILRTNDFARVIEMCKCHLRIRVWCTSGRPPQTTRGEQPVTSMIQTDIIFRMIPNVTLKLRIHLQYTNSPF